jgi:dephospho-CoA kinase
MKFNTRRIAVTGNIGSGKTAFCKILVDAGYLVINADELSKELLTTNENLKSKIIQIFGKESYFKGQINKKYIADKVFSSPINVNKINSIIHPVVISEIEKIFIEKEGKEKIIFVEAALIYEAKMENLFDYIVLITSEENIRKERKIKNGKMTAEEFYKRNANQLSNDNKKRKADFVFENNSSLYELKSKAELLLHILDRGGDD